MSCCYQGCFVGARRGCGANNTVVAPLAKATAERLSADPTEYASFDEILPRAICVSTNRSLVFLRQELPDLIFTPEESAKILGVPIPTTPRHSELVYTYRDVGNHHFDAVIKIAPARSQASTAGPSMRPATRAAGRYDALREVSDDSSDVEEMSDHASEVGTNVSAAAEGDAGDIEEMPVSAIEVGTKVPAMAEAISMNEAVSNERVALSIEPGSVKLSIEPDSVKEVARKGDEISESGVRNMFSFFHHIFISFTRIHSISLDFKGRLYCKYWK